MSKAIELKPCPFCGGSCEKVGNYHMHVICRDCPPVSELIHPAIQCKHCGSVMMGDAKAWNKRVLAELAKQPDLEKENERLKEENKGLKSGHFCPSPQISQMATTCNCAHSDKHRAMDWARIDQLEAEIERLKRKIKRQGSEIKRLSHFSKP